jgi:hypothetical protein
VPPTPSADPVIARIRELARADGADLSDAAEFHALLADLQLAERLPTNAFVVAANLLFHLLAADEAAPAAAEITP